MKRFTLIKIYDDRAAEIDFDDPAEFDEAIGRARTQIVEVDTRLKDFFTITVGNRE